MRRFIDLVSKPAREMDSSLPSAPRDAADNPSPLIKLDSNENPYGPSPRAIAAMREAMAESHFYPEDDCTALRFKLAAHHAVPPGQVLVTAGSTGMLSLLCHTLLGPGLNAVTSERSFIVYSMVVRRTGARLIEVPMDGDAFDLAAILAAINEDTRLVFLANPNNPTGTMLDAAAVDRFIAEVPQHVVVVLDEAYCDFALQFAARRDVEYSRSLDYVRRGASVVVLRTFSKAHGLAGLRVGYGIGPAELLEYCASLRDTYSVSSAAQAAALAALDDVSHVEQVVSNNAVQAEILRSGMSEFGYRVVPTSANFVYCDLGEDASGFAGKLRSERVSVRPLGAWGAANCVRVSIGTPEQNQVFLNAVRKITSRAKAQS